MELDMNNRWSRVAAQVEEQPVDRRNRAIVRGLVKPAAAAGKQTAAQIAGLTAAEIKRLAAKFAVKNVKAEDKNGVPATALSSVVSVWIEVTPDMAARWLKTNFVNRPISDDTVMAYARDMATGRWQATHQGIAFNDRDELIDGQHRLFAVVKCGKTIRMMVTFGLPSKIAGAEMTTMDCVDRGRTRSVADQLKIQHGLKNGGLIASLSASVAHLCLGDRLRRMSVGQTLDVYRAFQPGIDFATERRSTKPGLRSAGVLAAFAFTFELNPKSEDWLARLNTGHKVDAVPMMKLLRELLTGEQSAMLVQSMNRGIAELAVHCIWSALAGAGAQQLEQRPEEWLKAVEFFRAQQRAKVEKIAGLFKLP